jgi:hypothetical protein
MTLSPVLREVYTVPANGKAVAASPVFRSFSVQVKGTGASATAWSVVLEYSLDGVNWTTALTHNATDGSVLSSGATLFVATWYRTRLASITLAPATDIVVTSVALGGSV